MLRNIEISQDFKSFRVLFSISILLCVFAELCAIPITVQPTVHSLITRSSNENSSSTADNDLYVIKAVVYEIGILTDTDNTTSDSTERQEVKISLYDPSNKNDETSKLTMTSVPDAVLLNLHKPTAQTSTEE